MIENIDLNFEKIFFFRVVEWVSRDEGRKGLS